LFEVFRTDNFIVSYKSVQHYRFKDTFHNYKWRNNNLQTNKSNKAEHVQIITQYIVHSPAAQRKIIQFYLELSQQVDCLLNTNFCRLHVKIKTTATVKAVE